MSRYINALSQDELKVKERTALLLDSFVYHRVLFGLHNSCVSVYQRLISENCNYEGKLCVLWLYSMHVG